jgi:hypothetical protein
MICLKCKTNMLTRGYKEEAREEVEVVVSKCNISLTNNKEEVEVAEAAVNKILSNSKEVAEVVEEVVEEAVNKCISTIKTNVEVREDPVAKMKGILRELNLLITLEEEDQAPKGVTATTRMSSPLFDLNSN